MVVVRESPRAKVSPDKSASAWPPKSPFQALLSSPSGRRKWQDRKAQAEERSPSPSPLRRPMSSSQKLQAVSMGSEDDGEDDEEEAIRLKLEENRLKQELKRIERKRRLKESGKLGGKENEARPSSQTDTRPTSPRKSMQSASSRSQLSATNIEVPLSPTRDRITVPQEQVSPARRRLGLDSVPKATDVSLKRARDGTQVRRSDSVRSAASLDIPRSSFSERLRASRQTADQHEAKHDRIECTRSKGFDRDSTAFNATKRAIEGAGGSSRPRSATSEQSSSARERGGSFRTGEHGSISRGASTRITDQRDTARRKADGTFDQKQPDQYTISQRRPDDRNDSNPRSAAAEDAPSFDSFSEIHLSKRHIAHSVVAREMEGKEIYPLTRLLRDVKAPHYDPPDCEEDFVIFAILASKSSPYNQKATHKTSDMDKPQEDAEAPRNKFLVLKLTDLKYEIDLFLFGSGFDQFWKLTPGTLLAILNPAVLPPKTNQHSGRFSLKLSSCEDKVMEIGIARDLGYCTSVKKDGQQCDQWIDKRSTEICEFHLNLFIDKQRKGRMEVNTMWRGTGNVDSRTKSRSRDAGGFKQQMDRQKGITTHREYGKLYSVSMGASGSAATLLDAEDTSKLNGYTEGEKSRQRIAAAERERQLNRSLNNMGSSLGKDYLQAKAGNHAASRHSKDLSASDSAALFDKPKASELGLLNNKASNVHLSPQKDRKHHFGLGALSTSHGRDAIGWGNSRKAGILQPKQTRLGSPEKGQTKLTEKLSSIRPPAVRQRSQDGSISPSKRARFMLAGKGIREPGRESGGLDLKLLDKDHDDDDDDLDIV